MGRIRLTMNFCETLICDFSIRQRWWRLRIKKNGPSI